MTLPELLKKIEEYPFESQGRDLRLWADWQEFKVRIAELEERCQKAEEALKRDREVSE